MATPAQDPKRAAGLRTVGWLLGRFGLVIFLALLFGGVLVCAVFVDRP